MVAILFYLNFPFVRLPKLARKKLVEREAKKLGIQVRKRAWCKSIRCINVISRVADPHYLNADLDPSFRFNVDSEMAIHINAHPDPRILLLVKVMQICDHWYTDPPGLHFEPPRLHCERQQLSIAPLELKELLNFDLNNADPASENNADQDPQPLV